MCAFAARQQWGTSTGMAPGCTLRVALRCCRSAAERLPDRRLRLFSASLPPVILYTDASAESRSIRLGALLFLRFAVRPLTLLPTLSNPGSPSLFQAHGQ